MKGFMVIFVLFFIYLSLVRGSKYFYQETCDADAFNSGIESDEAQFLRKNIVKMGTCIKAPNTPSGMAEIFDCAEEKGAILLTSTLYLDSECLETTVADESVYVAAFGEKEGANRHVFDHYYDIYFGECTIGAEQLTVGTRFRCEDNPDWVTDPKWIGAISYDNWPNQEDVMFCPTNKLPNVRAYSTVCVKMGLQEPDSRVFFVEGEEQGLPVNSTRVSQLTYPTGFCKCDKEDQAVDTCTVKPTNTKVSAFYGNGTQNNGNGNSKYDAPGCGSIKMLNYSDENSPLVLSHGYVVENGSLDTSPWGSYVGSVKKLEEFQPDLRAIVISGSIVCVMCCACLALLVFAMNHFALKAEKYDGRETETERVSREGEFSSRDNTFFVEKPKMYASNGLEMEMSDPADSVNYAITSESEEVGDTHQTWQNNHSMANYEEESPVSAPYLDGPDEGEYYAQRSFEDLFPVRSVMKAPGTSGKERKGSLKPGVNVPPRKVSFQPDMSNAVRFQDSPSVGITENPLLRRPSIQVPPRRKTQNNGDTKTVLFASDVDNTGNNIDVEYNSMGDNNRVSEGDSTVKATHSSQVWGSPLVNEVGGASGSTLKSAQSRKVSTNGGKAYPGIRSKRKTKAEVQAYDGHALL